MRKKETKFSKIQYFHAGIFNMYFKWPVMYPTQSHISLASRLKLVSYFSISSISQFQARVLGLRQYAYWNIIRSCGFILPADEHTALIYIYICCSVEILNRPGYIFNNFRIIEEKLSSNLSKNVVNDYCIKPSLNSARNVVNDYCIKPRFLTGVFFFWDK